MNGVSNGGFTDRELIDLHAAVRTKVAICKDKLGRGRWTSAADKEVADEWLPVWMKLQFKIEDMCPRILVLLQTEKDNKRFDEKKKK